MQEINENKIKFVKKLKRVNLKRKEKANIMDKEIIEKLKNAEKEIEKGEGISSDIVFQNLRTKYGY